jgi:hypothetical protein
MTLLDDIALIRQFVTGETTLAANQNLRVESTFNTLQLLAKRRGVIATAHLNEGKVKTILGRAESEYWGLLHQVVQEYGWMPTDQQDQPGWMKYEHRQIPAGYQVNYTEARLLWKEWWVRSRQSPSSSIQLNLLIFVAKRQQWYPIRDIICHEGTLYIKTLVAELILLSNASVVWLNQSAVETVSKPEPSANAQPIDLQSPLVQSPVAQSSQGQFREASLPPLGTTHAIHGSESVGSPASSRESRTLATPTSQSPSVPASTRSPAEIVPSSSAIAATHKLQGVVKINQNRLHIQTAAGEVVIEGANMRFWLKGIESKVYSRTP